MFFGSKVKRVIDLEKAEEIYKSEEPEPLERGDRLALFLAAVKVFGPVLLLLGLLIWLVK